jgi:hypothetical protein
VNGRGRHTKGAAETAAQGDGIDVLVNNAAVLIGEHDLFSIPAGDYQPFLPYETCSA